MRTIQNPKPILALTFAFLAAQFSFAQDQLLTPLTRHVREVTVTGEARFLQAVPATQVMQLDIVLPLANQSGLDQFLARLYDPSSPSYHRYLTPAQFTALFGPTQEQYDAVVNFVKENGFTITGGTRSGMDVQVKGPVSAIENAFHISMGIYQHPTENRTFYAPDREPALALPFRIWHISGLSNYSIPHPMLEKRSDYARAHGMNAAEVVSHATTGSGPSQSFLGSDMRAAYYGGSSLDGTGQTLGLLEYQGTNLSDVSLYYANAKQTQPSTPITLDSVDGTSRSCNPSGCDDTEPTIDITQALGMAPGLSSLVVYIGSTDTALLGAMTTASPLPMTIGCSWGRSPADPATLNPYFQRMEAQGQTFFAASGDNSTWTTKNYEWPADDPYIVSVGGTDLTTSGAAGPWSSETAWVDSGGGISTDSIAIPAWQQLSGVINSSNGGSTSLRNGPDVAANANFTFYVCANGSCTANEYGGTSFAAPMWAAFIALANQQAAGSGGTGVGFLDPTIYAQNAASGTNYAANFHDVTSGTSGSYSAVAGYDLVTGWGSPEAALISALTSQTETVSASPSAVSIAPGGNKTTTITVGGCCSSAALSATPPTGFNVSFSPTSITGSGTSVMTISVASTVTSSPTPYSIPVTATVGSSTYKTSVSVTVTAAPSLTLSANPPSATLGRSSSTSSTITASGTFNSAVSLSASGMPSGVSVSFSPTSISAPNGTSKMTVTTRRPSNGSYSITIKGTSGSTTAQTTFKLTVN
jgi:kumamolisin